jgi:hypothetical protein
MHTTESGGPTPEAAVSIIREVVMYPPMPKRPLPHMSVKELRDYEADIDRWQRLHGPWESNRRRATAIKWRAMINTERRRRGIQLKLDDAS